MRFPTSECFQANRLLPAFLASILAFPPNLLAQQPPVQPPPESLPVVENLRVIPLAGNHAMNDLERRIMSPLVVQVLDQNARPVEGAQVILRGWLDGARAGNFSGSRYRIPGKRAGRDHYLDDECRESGGRRERKTQDVVVP
jgi:hypothetical protein